ncbi:helix-turn-helix domain-containing protein [Streptosporangium sp. NBC_01469]|uniref:helix-turn-helix domain-containing protein n=1 Tax=Streptosporangium sp. NBC_01469 TaxID=2903898 RepID=UPI002E2843B7|nr:helix-turn-helix transcriptional regulator [Streptosporangium sp. NBC_01469]
MHSITKHLQNVFVDAPYDVACTDQNATLILKLDRYVFSYAECSTIDTLTPWRQAMTNGGQGPTVRRRRLATELRRLREAAGLTMEEVAQSLDMSRATISRLETGKTARPRPRDIRDILKLYKVGDLQQEAVMDLARGARERGWWEQYKGVFTGTYVGLEAEASSIDTFEPLVIPGLLQTSAYAAELVRASLADPAEIDKRVEARMRRQEILQRPNPPRYRAIIDEAALLRPVGDTEVMRDQFRKLIDTCSLEHVTIQVMPMSAGPHIGLWGQFVILGFPESTDQNVVYIETPTDNLYLEEPEHLERYNLVMQRLVIDALGADASIAHLSKLIDRL